MELKSVSGRIFFAAQPQSTSLPLLLGVAK